MLGELNSFIKWFDGLVWGPPLIVLILAVGIYFTLRLGLLQIRRLPRALRYMVKNEEGGKGDVTSFGALCTALSATIGTGNIVGVATAITAGGPGALFWMWIAAFFGMATKYAEGLLAIKYRRIGADGHVLGGPFYYIENGMGKRWIWLAKLFAFFGACVGLLGIGTFSQVNGISSAVNGFFDSENQWTVTLFGMQYSWTVVITGILVTVFAALVIVGGLKRIARVSEVVVPFMAILYVASILLILILHMDRIGPALSQIIVGAFQPAAVTGGAVGSIMVAVQMGVARGIFSNESGLGSAPIAAAAAKTHSCVRQGLVSMTGTFIDTIVICTMTGLAIVLTGAWQIEGLEGVMVTTQAFASGLHILGGQIPQLILMVCLVFFAFTTILGWNYYGERCLEYLSGGSRRAVMVYRWLYILAIFIGPYMTIEAVWNIADIFNGLMAFPNLIALVALSGVVIRETRRYFAPDRLPGGAPEK